MRGGDFRPLALSSSRSGTELHSTPFSEHHSLFLRPLRKNRGRVRKGLFILLQESFLRWPARYQCESLSP